MLRYPNNTIAGKKISKAWDCPQETREKEIKAPNRIPATIIKRRCHKRFSSAEDRVAIHSQETKPKAIHDTMRKYGGPESVFIIQHELVFRLIRVSSVGRICAA